MINKLVKETANYLVYKIEGIIQINNKAVNKTMNNKQSNNFVNELSAEQSTKQYAKMQKIKQTT